ncbi:putative methyltransferase [uncultured Mediterranean phage uvMED]|nr:putative methyltransferase [uncultured Mediterranean phage uvMED]BAQ88994.1 putative methyltransferase [uncultured Mediterranean phage uvMED]BAQ89070.1 putative methyltransferase [uncultured Mediterranean phage uvMED]
MSIDYRILFSRENPSPQYIKLLDEYKKMHEGGKVFDGRSLRDWIDIIHNLLQKHSCKTLLDYGSGQGTLYTNDYHYLTNKLNCKLQDYWGLDKVYLYEPALKNFDVLPDKTFDAVICTDVLEHIPKADLGWVLEEMFARANKLLFLNIATYPALKTFEDGTNVHVSLFPVEDWLRFIERIHQRYPTVTVQVYFNEVKEQKVLTSGFKLEGRDARCKNTVSSETLTAQSA